MKTEHMYEELRSKFKDEDRAKLVIQQLRTYQESKQKRRWWQKLALSRRPRTKPQSWD
ncbi:MULTISPECIES: hypothetical protein [unclassified Paenibacillus]|uniref:hypothetical protein n=1 Tax=unclassified Paenibacillus TaxID=185978 RepID=UPI000A94E569|nr:MULTISPECIES: hypothetical protein [unclassified Paenibacillus]